MQLQTARPKSIETGLVEMARAPGGFNAGFDPIALPHIELAARTPDERVDCLVGITVTEAAEKDAPLVRNILEARRSGSH